MHSDHRPVGQHRPGLLVGSAALALLAVGVAVWYLVVGDWGMVKLNTIPAGALHEAGMDVRQPPASLRACELLAGSGLRLAETACPGFSAARSKAQLLSGGDGETVLADCSFAEIRMNRVPCWLVVTAHPYGGQKEKLCYADPRVMRLPPDFADTTPQALIRTGNLIFVDVHTAEVRGVVLVSWRSEPPPTTLRGCG
jgi:hypothetical protein